MVPMLMTLAATTVGIWGNVVQGRAERQKAQTDTERYKTQIGWQQEQIDWSMEDTARQREAGVGSLITGASAMGVEGASIHQARATTLGEYNRAINRMDTQRGQLDTQAGWADDDLKAFTKQSKVNQMLGIGGTLLGGGAQMYGQGVQSNLWGPGQVNPHTGQRESSWWDSDRKDKGFKSIWQWGNRYAN